MFMRKATVMAFVSGAIVGAICAVVGLRKAYEKRLQDEIADVKETFSRFFDVSVFEPNKKEESDNEEEKSPISRMDEVQQNYAEYAKRIDQYTNYSTDTNDGTLYEMDAPTYESDVEYTSPSEFGIIDGYEECFYTYYSDDIMIEGSIRNDDMIVHDPYNLIGDKEIFVDHIGEHEEITLLGVNHRIKTYFEVTFVDEPYNEDEED